MRVLAGLSSRMSSQLRAAWRGAFSAWAAMDRDRRLTIVAAVSLLASLWAPWYRETVIARGVTGLRTLSEAMTGWQALSSAGIVSAIVAGAIMVTLFARCRPGRRAPAAARDGLVIGIGAGVCVVLLVVKLLDHGGATGGGLAEATVAIRWGVVLALACALALTWLGVRIMRPGARPGRRAAVPETAVAETAVVETAVAEATVAETAARPAAPGDARTDGARDRDRQRRRRPRPDAGTTTGRARTGARGD